MMSVAIIVTLVVFLVIFGGYAWLTASQQSQSQEVDWAARISGSIEDGSGTVARTPKNTSDPVTRWATNHLRRAGLELETGMLRRLLGYVALTIGLVWLVFNGVAALVMLGVEIVLIYVWLLAREARRRDRVLAQLPEFLEHMGRSLSAGNSLDDSLQEATADAEEPIRGLFISVARQVRLGAPMDDVLDEAAEIHQISELRVMAMAARTNRRFGGSLKRIFKSLIQAIRERDAAARELRALTAETRFSAVVLAAVPVLLSGYILLQNPEYYQNMWDDGTGRSLLLFSLGLQVTGIFVIWRMLRAADRDSE